MHARTLERLRRLLRGQEPEDPGSWEEISRELGRGLAARLELDEEEARRLGEVWRGAPRDPGRTNLYLALRGLRLPAIRPAAPPPWAEDAVAAPTHWVDGETGYPLQVVRLVDGAAMSAVNPRLQVFADDQPVTLGRFRGFLESTTHPPPPWLDWALEPDRPATLVDFDDARTYAGWVGGSLPAERDWWDLAEKTGSAAVSTGFGRPRGNLESDVPRNPTGVRWPSRCPVPDGPEGHTPYLGRDLYEWTTTFGLRTRRRTRRLGGGTHTDTTQTPAQIVVSGGVGESRAGHGNRLLAYPETRSPHLGFRVWFY